MIVLEFFLFIVGSICLFKYSLNTIDNLLVRNLCLYLYSTLLVRITYRHPLCTYTVIFGFKSNWKGIDKVYYLKKSKYFSNLFNVPLDDYKQNIICK